MNVPNYYFSLVSSSSNFRRREKLKNKDKDDKQSSHAQNLSNICKNKHNKNMNSIKNRRLQALSTISKFFLPDKRPRLPIIPPTKFLLGGNISDPLNLNSLKVSITFYFIVVFFYDIIKNSTW
jgi:hypothetical protein